MNGLKSFQHCPNHVLNHFISPENDIGEQANDIKLCDVI